LEGIIREFIDEHKATQSVQPSRINNGERRVSGAEGRGQKNGTAKAKGKAKAK
jgi:hypothetical protein